MTQTRATYELAKDAWTSLSADIDAAIQGEDLYWTLRAFGLEGRFLIRWEGQELIWGGFLLDLACALSEWVTTGGEGRSTFRPVEQSNNLEIDARAGTIVVVSGPFRLEIPAEEFRATIETFLCDLSVEAANREPRLVGVAGFEWMRDRMSPAP